MSKKDKLRKSAGYILLEQMICVAIIGIMAGPFLAMYMDSRKFSEDHYRFTLATTILQKEMKHVKTLSYKDIGKTSEQPPMPSEVIEDLKRLEGGHVNIWLHKMKERPRFLRVRIEIEWINPFEQTKTLSSVIFVEKR